MKIIDCEQGTPEWFEARLGVLSASNFGKIVTATGKWSSQADAYINELAAEVITGERKEMFQSFAMTRGVELEEEARDTFCYTYDYEVDQVGFCIRDDFKIGCSPDGLLYEKSGLEIKCPLAHTHLGYLKANVLPTAYIQQVQGSLYVTDREEWHFYSYHPSFDQQLRVIVHRDEEYIKAMAGHLERAANEIQELIEKFKGENHAE